MAKRRNKKATREDLPTELAEVKTVRMTHFQAENILRLKAVNLAWDESNQIILEGANEQGKSSVIESFAMLLAGGSGPQKAIRRGTSKGKIVAQFETEKGLLTVQKTFTEERKPALKITLEGRRGAFASGQTILDVLFDHVSLDPLHFARLDPKAQAEMLAQVIGYDPTPLNKKRKELYDQRTDANREMKRLQAAYESMPELDRDAPAEEVSVSDLMAELKKRQAHNEKGDGLQNVLTTTSDLVKELQTDIEDLRKQLAEMEADLAKATKEKAAALTALSKFEPQDTSEIEQQLSKADQINAAVRGNRARDEACKAYMEAQTDWENLNDAIDQIDEKKKKAFLAAMERLPIPDLDITEDGVMYKHAPFAQAGNSATIKISAAIAMALNKHKPIKLLMIDNAEAMGPEATKMVTDMAAENGFQVFMARVMGLSGASEGSVVIEDGEVK